MMGLFIFDLDGTLVDTSGDIVFSVNRLLVERGLEPLDHAEVMQHVGLGTPYLMAAVLGIDMGDPGTAIAVTRFVEIYAEHPVDHSMPYPGVRETLDTLASTHALAIVSNKTQPLVDATLEALDLGSPFSVTLGGDALPRLKPHPDGLFEAMKATRSRPEDTIMVGDLSLDISAGRAAGTRTVWASYGFGRLVPGDPVPDGAIESFAEVLDWSRGDRDRLH